MSFEDNLDLLQETINASSDIIFWLDSQLKVTYANTSAQLHNISLGSGMEGSNLHPANYSWKELTLMVGDFSLSFQVNSKSENGQVLNFDFKAFRVASDPKKSLCCIGTIKTPRNKIQPKVHPRSGNLKTLLKTANETLWDYEITTGSLNFDTRGDQLLGFLGNELPANVDRWKKIIHPEDHARVMKDMTAHLRGQSNSFSTVHRIKTKIGGYKWFLLRGKAVAFDKKDKATRIVGTLVDVDHMRSTWAEKEQLLKQITERNKELNCLYAVSQLVANKSLELPEVFINSIIAIGKAWQYPKITTCRIMWRGTEYTSINYKVCEWTQKAQIVSSEGKEGFIEVGYLEKKKTAHEGPFLFEERQLINSLADHYGNMIDARNAEENIVASVLKTEDRERQRISKELHDSLGQTLSAVSLNMDAVKNEKHLLSDKVRKSLEVCLELTNLAISESRSISHNLMPSALSDFGYPSAIENILMSFEGATDIDFVFYHNLRLERLNPSLELGLYRITQECLNNIIKHASATKATIQLMRYPDLLILTIDDNGKGFDLDSAGSGPSFGLNSIKHRISSLSGVLIIDSVDGSGTTITIQIPLENNTKNVTESTDHR